VTVVADRVITVNGGLTPNAGTVDLGYVHAGNAASGSVALTSAGDSSHYTTLTLAPGTYSDGTVSIIPASSTTFDGTTSLTAPVSSGTFSVANAYTGTVYLQTAGENLTGETDPCVAVAYTV
jgi:hypothetical protein